MGIKDGDRLPIRNVYNNFQEWPEFRISGKWMNVLFPYRKL